MPSITSDTNTHWSNYPRVAESIDLRIDFFSWAIDVTAKWRCQNGNPRENQPTRKSHKVHCSKFAFMAHLSFLSSFSMLHIVVNLSFIEEKNAVRKLQWMGWYSFFLSLTTNIFMKKHYFHKTVDKIQVKLEVRIGKLPCPVAASEKSPLLRNPRRKMLIQLNCV